MTTSSKPLRLVLYYSPHFTVTRKQKSNSPSSILPYSPHAPCDSTFVRPKNVNNSHSQKTLLTGWCWCIWCLHSCVVLEGIQHINEQSSSVKPTSETPSTQPCLTLHSDYDRLPLQPKNPLTVCFSHKDSSQEIQTGMQEHPILTLTPKHNYFYNNDNNLMLPSLRRE